MLLVFLYLFYGTLKTHLFINLSITVRLADIHVHILLGLSQMA